MIKNDQQYQQSLDWLQRFEQSVAELDSNESLKVDAKRWQIHRDSYQSQVDKLKEEITEYERLINCATSKPLKLKVDSLNKLPDSLIKARVAAKISQKELADRLGVDEEQVKDYEYTNYQSASFVEILEISTVLGVEFENAVVLVDFEEIDSVKRTIQKWDKERVHLPTNWHKL